MQKQTILKEGKVIDIAVDNGQIKHHKGNIKEKIVKLLEYSKGIRWL